MMETEGAESEADESERGREMVVRRHTGELQLQWLLIGDTLGKLWLRRESESGRGESEREEDIGGGKHARPGTQ